MPQEFAPVSVARISPLPGDMASRSPPQPTYEEPAPEPVIPSMWQYYTDPVSSRKWCLCAATGEMFWVVDKVWHCYVDPDSMHTWFWCELTQEWFWANDPTPWVPFRNRDGHRCWWNEESAEWFILGTDGRSCTLRRLL